MKIQRNILFAIITVALLLFVGLLVIFAERNKKEEVHAVHWHAGFQVFEDNQMLDFSDTKYMAISPCGGEGEEWEGKEQMEKAHLHDNVGDVVHVHREGGIWKDLFTNMNFAVDTQEVKGYQNGTEVENILDLSINQDDSVVMFIGENEDIESKVENRVATERIREIGEMSENCGTGNASH